MTNAFDTLAPTYDRTFTHQQLATWLRKTVWSHMPFHPGDHVLELGCGTGEDALWLARHGIHVTATDASPEMLRVAQAKTDAADYSDRVQFARFDMNDVAFPILDQSFDGAFSNFGAFNCVEDRNHLVQHLADHIRPGGKVVLVVMGPLCPWEIMWHLAHAQLQQAFRRFRAGQYANVDGESQVRVWYPSPATLQREFKSQFRHVQTVGVGTLLPPTYLNHLVQRYSAMFKRFAAIDRRIGSHFPMTWLNDHYLIVFERR